jgi:hypothetical protein
LKENFLIFQHGKLIIKSAIPKVNVQKGIALTLLTPTVALVSKSKVAFTFVAVMSLAAVMSVIVVNIISRTQATGRSSS